MPANISIFNSNKAAGSDIDTGTDDFKYVTSLALEDSNIAKSPDIVKTRHAIITIGTNAGGGTLAKSFNFSTVFGETFGSDAAKIQIQISTITTTSSGLMIFTCIRQITTTDVTTNSRRIDNPGGNWSSETVLASLTVSELV